MSSMTSSISETRGKDLRLDENILGKSPYRDKMRSADMKTMIDIPEALYYKAKLYPAF